MDTAGDGKVVTLPEPPYLRIVGGPAEKLVVTLPSMVLAGEQFQIQVRAEDAWGNPAAAYRGTVAIQSENVRVPAEQLTFGEGDKGVQWIEGCTVTQPGIHRLTVTDEKVGLTIQSNPILCQETKTPYNLYWVRVVQTDMEMAWSSPIYVDYVADSQSRHRQNRADP